MFGATLDKGPPLPSPASMHGHVRDARKVRGKGHHEEDRHHHAQHGREPHNDQGEQPGERPSRCE